MDHESTEVHSTEDQEPVAREHGCQNRWKKKVKVFTVSDSIELEKSTALTDTEPH